MDEKQKQEEMKKIVSLCDKNGIQYYVSKLDFIEKDTGQIVDKEAYTLLVIKEGQVRKLYGFYSMYGVCQYVENVENKGVPIFDNFNKEIIGFIFINNNEHKESFVDFYQLNN